MSTKEWVRETAAQIREAIHNARGLSAYGAHCRAEEILERRLPLLPDPTPAAAEARATKATEWTDARLDELSADLLRSATFISDWTSGIGHFYGNLRHAARSAIAELRARLSLPPPEAKEAAAPSPETSGDYSGLIEDLRAGVQSTGGFEDGVELFNVEGASDLMGQAADALASLSASHAPAALPPDLAKIISNSVRDTFGFWDSPYIISLPEGEVRERQSREMAENVISALEKASLSVQPNAGPSTDAIAALEELAGRLERKRDPGDHWTVISGVDAALYALALRTAVKTLKAYDYREEEDYPNAGPSANGGKGGTG